MPDISTSLAITSATVAVSTTLQRRQAATPAKPAVVYSADFLIPCVEITPEMELVFHCLINSGDGRCIDCGRHWRQDVQPKRNQND